MLHIFPMFFLSFTNLVPLIDENEKDIEEHSALNNAQEVDMVNRRIRWHYQQSTQ